MIICVSMYTPVVEFFPGSPMPRRCVGRTCSSGRRAVDLSGRQTRSRTSIGLPRTLLTTPQSVEYLKSFVGYILCLTTLPFASSHEARGKVGRTVHCSFRVKPWRTMGSIVHALEGYNEAEGKLSEKLPTVFAGYGPTKRVAKRASETACQNAGCHTPGGRPHSCNCGHTVAYVVKA